MSRLLSILAWLLFCITSHALDINHDPKESDYLLGRGIGLPLENRAKTFRPEDKQANFTFVHGVEHVAVQGERLTFRLSEKRATLGWGNYMGKQPMADIRDMGQQKLVLQLRLKQSAGPSKWTARLWRDGQRLTQAATCTLEGTDWQELEFKALATNGANADGLELTVEGQVGAEVELAWLKLVQPTYQGYCRYEFDLPEGKIWRAVADVGSANYRNWYGVDEMMSRLYVNGQVVKRRGFGHLYHTDGVDLAPYLKPGRNCVGFYGFRIGYSPFLYFQARITMESGDVVTVASGLDWTYCPKESGGWSEPGFDDDAWTKVEGGTGPWLSSRGVGNRVAIPAYSGRLVITNPGRRDLFYADTSDVVVDVHAPLGLKEREPSLSYVFGRADAGGHCEQLTEATVSRFRAEGNSLVYRADLDRHARGVYALALSLVGSDGAIIEERPREPIVVLRKKALKTVEGREFTEGLDLELEDRIDFTDPRDPHPWTEGEMPARYGIVAPKVERPTIVRKDGLTYREVTATRRGSGFGYRFEFKHPGSFYYLELEYPDDARRVIEVSISSKTPGVWTNSQSGVGAETGGKFLPTGKMQKLRWIHVADPGPHSVDIINVVDGDRAAAKSLKVYRIKGDLPSVGSGSARRYGIHSERCFYTSGIGMNFGVGQPKNRQTAKEEDEKISMMQRLIRDLVWQEATGERYVQYLKFSGQNCHIMGCIQYNEFNTPYLPAPVLEDSRIAGCMKTMMANLFEINEIDFYAGVEFSQSQNVRTYANNAQLAAGADTMWMVSSEGQQLYGHRVSTVVPNWLHPDMRGKFGELMESLCDTFGHLSRFRGVHGLLGPVQRAGYWIPSFGDGRTYDDPLSYSYDDYSMALFEKDTGLELPIPKTDPRRFQKRAAILRNPAFRGRFMDWRCDKVKQFFGEAVHTLRAKRRDLEFVNVLAVEDAEFFQHLVESRKPFEQTMRDFGIDMGRLNAVDGLWTGRWTLSWRQTHGVLPTRDPYCWIARTSPDVVSAFEDDTKRYVLVRTSWDENVFATGGHARKGRNDLDRLVEPDWVMNMARIRALPQPGGYHCREAYAQAIITADPQLLMGGFTDININVGHEQMLRSILRTYTHLPPEEFTPVLDTGLDTNLAIRQLTKDNESYFYVANPCQWHVKGRVFVKTPGEVHDLVSGRRIQEAGVTVALTPFGIAAFRVTSPELAITGYETEPLAAAGLARLTGIMDRVEKLVADPEVKLSLSLPDRGFVRDTLAKARGEIAKRQYARAWSLMTHHRFWTCWQDFLEKAATAQARLPASLGAMERNADATTLPVLRARRVNTAISIDGRLTEAAWSQVPWSTGFWLSNKKPALVDSAVKALHDGKGLYLAIACADRNTSAIKATAKDEMGLNPSKDDHIAIFIQPDESQPLYYQLAYNAKGIQFDQRVAGGDRDYDYRPQWSHATQIEKGYWLTEVRLPYEAFGVEAPQQAWRINVCRRVRDDVLDRSTWSWVSGDWHNANRFGRLEWQNH